MNTADADLEAAQVLLEARRYNLAAFHAQQAAEKSLKAAITMRGKSHRAHACVTLLDVLRADGAAVPEGLDTVARRLDLHYIQSRYPNGLGGDPTTYYDAEIARECLEHARRIIAYARTSIA